MAKLLTQTKSFFLKCKRVWHIMKKPSKKEYTTIAKVSAIGIGVLGILGFAISIIMNVFK
ncbi:MAG: protein translocase SEC61 complex subunit gamma [Candidatus Pacearchaeota archaeon]|jgi:protein transport protein SEC61 subunit gamma-like protein